MKKLLIYLCLILGVSTVAYALPWYIAHDFEDKSVMIPGGELSVPDLKITDDLTVAGDMAVGGDLTVTTLLNLTGGAVFPTGSVTAVGNSLATSATISRPVSYVAGADGAVGVKPPVGTIGQCYFIINVVAAQLKLYPPAAGAQINAAGAGTAVNVESGESALVCKVAADTWYGGIFVTF